MGRCTAVECPPRRVHQTGAPLGVWVLGPLIILIPERRRRLPRGTPKEGTADKSASSSAYQHLLLLWLLAYTPGRPRRSHGLGEINRLR
eukprot:scaffold211328_cov31-Tisochrysis_lutea.AAC.1